MDTCIRIAESPCCASETSTTLQTDSAPTNIQKRIVGLGGNNVVDHYTFYVFLIVLQ